MKLTEKEQRNVRAALRFLRYRAGGWGPICEALSRSQITISMVASGRRPVTAELAYSVARLTATSLDDLLAGTWAATTRVCPHCGRTPDDFGDEETVVEEEQREALLKLAR